MPFKSFLVSGGVYKNYVIENFLKYVLYSLNFHVHPLLIKFFKTYYQLYAWNVSYLLKKQTVSTFATI